MTASWFIYSIDRQSVVTVDQDTMYLLTNAPISINSADAEGHSRSYK